MDHALSYFWSLPVLTRTWCALSTGLTAAVTLDLLERDLLVYDWVRISQHLEWWRLITCFCYANGPLNKFPVLILLYLMAMVGQQYERHPFNCGAGGRRPDFAFALVVCAISIVATVPLLNHCGPGVVQWYTNMTDNHNKRFIRRPAFRMEAVFTKTLVYAVLYLWSRKHPHARANLNFVPMPAAYLPLAHICFGLLLGHRIHETVHGIVVGHFCYYWTVVVPTVTRGRLGFTTPQVLIDLCGTNQAHDNDRRHPVFLEELHVNGEDEHEEEDVGLPPRPHMD